MNDLGNIAKLQFFEEKKAPQQLFPFLFQAVRLCLVRTPEFLTCSKASLRIRNNLMCSPKYTCSQWHEASRRKRNQGIVEMQSMRSEA